MDQFTTGDILASAPRAACSHTLGCVAAAAAASGAMAGCKTAASAANPVVMRLRGRLSAAAKWLQRLQGRSRAAARLHLAAIWLQGCGTGFQAGTGDGGAGLGAARSAGFARDLPEPPYTDHLYSSLRRPAGVLYLYLLRSAARPRARKAGYPYSARRARGNPCRRRARRNPCRPRRRNPRVVSCGVGPRSRPTFSIAYSTPVFGQNTDDLNLA